MNKVTLAVTKQVLVMALIAATGLGLKKWGKIDNTLKAPLSNLMMYLVSPILVVNSFIRPFVWTEFKGWLVAFAFGVVVHLVFIPLSFVLFPSKKDPKYNGINRFAAVYSNAGFIGIPLVQASFGEGGVFYIIAFVAASGLFIWSAGAKDISGGTYKLNLQKILITPTMVATYISLAIYLLQIPLGSIVTGAVGYISNLNTALSMVFIGLVLSEIDFKGLFSDLRVIKTSLVRLLLYPAICLALGLVLNLLSPGSFTDMIVVTLIATSAPAATATAMMSTIFGNDDVYAGKIVALTTAGSMLTVPLMVFLGTLLLK